MKERVVDKNLVAFCGLYCGGCKKYLMEKCPGCAKNEKASWCNIRTCCLSKNYKSCADCQTSVAECKKFTNFISKLFSLIFRSDRKACIDYIKASGYESYANEMVTKNKMSFKK